MIYRRDHFGVGRDRLVEWRLVRGYDRGEPTREWRGFWVGTVRYVIVRNPARRDGVRMHGWILTIYPHRGSRLSSRRRYPTWEAAALAAEQHHSMEMEAARSVRDALSTRVLEQRRR